MSEGETRQEPEIISTGMFYDKVTGQDASKPVRKKRLEIVQVGLNPSNLQGKDPNTDNLERLADAHLVSVLKSLGRIVPDNLSKRVGQYHTIKAAKFTQRYMPRRK